MAALIRCQDCGQPQMIDGPFPMRLTIIAEKAREIGWRMDADELRGVGINTTCPACLDSRRAGE